MPATEPCRNCGTSLAGRWCHACGQDSRDPLRDFPVLAGEFFDSVFGWDSRLGRSLRLLFGSPGALTTEFVAGRRVRYLGPLRLYLIISVLFFACYALTPDPVIATIAGLGDGAAGQVRLGHVAHWLPTLMILILPGFALIVQLLLRDLRRGFIEHLVFALHFGTFSFAMISAGQLLALALGVLDLGPMSVLAVFAAHGVNAAYLYFALLRHYQLSVRSAMLRMLGFCVLMTLLLGGVASFAQRMLERYG